MINEIIPQEIFETPDAIRATVAETRAAAREAAAAIRSRAPRRIFIIGNGTSLYSSMAAAYTARSLAAENDPLVLAFPSGDFRYYTPALAPSDVLVGVSASGEFRDVLALFEEYRGRNLCVGISHVPGSSITRLADHMLISAGGVSEVPVMTKTYASTLTAAHLLMLETFLAPDDWFADLIASADRCQEALEGSDAIMGELVPKFAEMEHAFYFGGGPAYAAALEGALKMKEMALLHAEGSETWEMASGPATMVSENTFIAALFTGGETDQATESGAQHARDWGATVLEVGAQADAGGWQIPVPAPEYEPFATLGLIPPLALLAFRVARQRGLNPDRPQWRERYLSQGMSHILGA